MFKSFLKLQNFFSVNDLQEVDQVLLNNAMRGRRDEWLKGRPKVNLLPRHVDFMDGIVFYTQNLSLDDLGERIRWVVNTLEGDWLLCKGNLYLKEDTDIVYYRLRWPENCKRSS